MLTKILIGEALVIGINVKKIDMSHADVQGK